MKTPDEIRAAEQARAIAYILAPRTGVLTAEDVETLLAALLPQIVKESETL